MNGGVDNPLWKVIAGTVTAYPTFLPSIATVRHFDPVGFKARDVRFGYALAVSWSFAIAMVVASDGDPVAALAAWVLTSGLVLLMYEIALQSTNDIQEGV